MLKTGGVWRVCRVRRASARSQWPRSVQTAASSAPRAPTPPTVASWAWRACSAAPTHRARLALWGAVSATQALNPATRHANCVHLVTTSHCQATTPAPRALLASRARRSACRRQRPAMRARPTRTGQRLARDALPALRTVWRRRGLWVPATAAAALGFAIRLSLRANTTTTRLGVTAKAITASSTRICGGA